MSEPDVAGLGEEAAGDEVFSAAMKTRVADPAEPLDLLPKLRLAAELLTALPALPNAPAILYRGLDGGVRAELVGTGICIGRSDKCTVNFPGVREMSREHCKVIAMEGRCAVEDLGSSNGTKICGKGGRLRPHEARELCDGDIIEAGGLAFLYLGGEPESGS